MCLLIDFFAVVECVRTQGVLSLGALSWNEGRRSGKKRLEETGVRWGGRE